MYCALHCRDVATGHPGRGRRASVVALLAGLVAAVATPLSAAGVERTAAAGPLALHASFVMRATPVDCPGGNDLPLSCLASSGNAVVPGLGKVSESYVRRVEENPADCGPESFRILSQTVRFTVAGKGELQLVVPATGCLLLAGLDVPKYPAFTITGGSGAYSGASGSGTLTQHAGRSDGWDGTLAVAGREFDVTAPTLRGAAARTVRAAKGATGARVAFRVTAFDRIDGAVKAACRPASGSRFRIGRTTVHCSASDSSGNTRTAAFAVTVKAHRSPAALAQPQISVVMSGLDAPRGIAFAKDGDLYVAEAGRGAPCIGTNEIVVPPRNVIGCVGSSGAVSRLHRGRQTRAVTGLPSWAAKVSLPVPEENGPSDVDLINDGRLNVTVGWGGTPSARSLPAVDGRPFGSLLRMGLAGERLRITDISAYEQASNPAGGPLDSNPFGVLAEPGARYIADAGGNAVYRVGDLGAVQLVAAFSNVPNPAGCFVPVPPPGGPAPPFSEPVPTSVVRGPDGALYVSGLTGFPFCAGAATIWRLEPGHAPVAFQTGFKMIVDLAFAPDGTLYVLQHATSPSLNSGPGQLLALAPGGTRAVVDTGSLLVQPAGLAIGPDGALYVSNKSVVPGQGEVLRIAP